MIEYLLLSQPNNFSSAAAGQSILYFPTPWGMELISYPKGMAYEKTAKTVLWSTTEPTK